MTKETWTLGSLLALRCPVCGADSFKAGLYRTAKRCGRCGEDFEPEAGFFAGAIYPMYGMGALVGGVSGLLAAVFGASFAVLLTTAVATMLICSPWIFWVSRLGFLHTNHRFFKDQA